MLLLDIFGLVFDAVWKHFAGGGAGEVLGAKRGFGYGYIQTAGLSDNDRRQLHQGRIQKIRRLLTGNAKLFTLGQIVENEPIGNVFLGIGTKAQMSYGSGQLPIEIPLCAVLRAVKIQEVFQNLRCRYEFGVKFLRKRMGRLRSVGEIDAALQVVVRKKAHLLGEGDFTIAVVVLGRGFHYIMSF